MEHWTISFSTLIYLCGAIVTVWGVVKIIKELKKPSDDLKRKVNEHEEKLVLDHKTLKEQEEYNKIICKSLLAIIDHEITGNGIERLRNTKNELQNFLINK